MGRSDHTDYFRQAPAQPVEQDRPWTAWDIAFFCVASFISGGIAMAWYIGSHWETFA